MNWWSALSGWAVANSGLIAFFFALVVIPVGAYFGPVRGRMGHVTIADQIAEQASWPSLIALWRRGASESYFAAIRGVLAFAARIYGPKPLSWRAYDRCLLIAFIYPLLALLIAWMAANQHSPGGMALFTDEPRWWMRLGRAALLASAVSLAGWIIANSERFSDFLVAKLL